MFKDILVPTDFADKNEQAIQTALELARQNNGRVNLLHVVEKVGDETDKEIEDFYLKLAEKASQKLTAWQHRFQADFGGINIEKTILVGNRAREILRFCQESRADLMVMTSHTINEPGQKGFGTLSHQMALFAPISVLVVR